MLNSVITSLKTCLQERSGFIVRGPEYVTGLERGLLEELFLGTTAFPCILLDYRKELRERAGGGLYHYTFNGSILVGTLDIQLDIAGANIRSYVSDSGYVLAKLFTSPTPTVSSKHLQFDIGEAFERSLTKTEDGYMLFWEIPCNIKLSV
jgi:hypothetical protein